MNVNDITWILFCIAHIFLLGIDKDYVCSLAGKIYSGVICIGVVLLIIEMFII